MMMIYCRNWGTQIILSGIYPLATITWPYSVKKMSWPSSLSHPNLNMKEVIISESDFMAIIISDRTEKDQMRGWINYFHCREPAIRTSEHRRLHHQHHHDQHQNYDHHLININIYISTNVAMAPFFIYLEYLHTKKWWTRLKFPSEIFGCGENERQRSEILNVIAPIALIP